MRLFLSRDQLVIHASRFTAGLPHFCQKKTKNGLTGIEECVSSYVVVSRAGTLPVYRVQPETNADGPIHTLHRYLLLPCSIPPACGVPSPIAATSPCRPHTQSQKTTDIDFMEDMAEEEFEWSVPNIEIQPATFHFTSSPL